MYVELIDGRHAGQLRDIDNGTALDLIKLGRAKRAFSDPTPAAPVGAGAYRGTPNVAAAKPEPSPEVSTAAANEQNALQGRLEEVERQIRQSQEQQQIELQQRSAESKKKKTR